MKHFVNSLFNGLLFSNIFIALCAVFFTLETAHLLHIPNFNSYYLFVVFGGTIVIYCSQGLIGINQIVGINTESRFAWLRKNKKWLLLGIISSIFCCFIVAIILPIKIIIGLAITFVVSAAYFLPTLELRKIPFIKNMIVAITWVSTTSIVPLLFFSSEQCESIFTISIVAYVIKNTLFIYTLCLIFDNRDILLDNQQCVKTFAAFYSEKINNKIIYVCVAAYMIVSLFTNTIVIDSIISTNIILLTQLSLKNKNELFYLFYVDGLILLKSLLVLCFM